MKRPLCLLCAAAAIVLALWGSAESPTETAVLEQVQEKLTETASDDGFLSLEGTVADSSASADGVQITLNHLVIYNGNSLTETADSRKHDNSLNNDNAIEQEDSLKNEDSANRYLREISQNSILLTKSNNVSSFLTLREEICVMVSSSEDTFLPGDRIHAEGTYSSFEPASNPGQFDTRAYYFALDTVGSVRDAKLTMVSKGKRSLLRTLYGIRRALRESYAQILDDKDARIASAITLGEKKLMEHEWKLIYQEGGIAHIIAVSGLHITMIGMAMYRLLRFLGLPFAASALPCAFAACCYTLMAGCSVSALRAFVMFLIWLGAQICGRKYDMKTSVALAALLILTRDTGTVQSASFVLSFAAILSLAILVPALQEACPFGRTRRHAGQRDGKKDGGLRVRRTLSQAAREVWLTLCGGLGIWLGTLPVSLAFFYQTSPWSILVNLAVVPLMSAVMASGLISGVAGLIFAPAGVFLAAPLHYLLRLFEILCSLEQKLPLAVWVIGNPGIVRILVYYAVLAAALAAARIAGERRRAEGTRGSGDSGPGFVRILRRPEDDRRAGAARGSGDSGSGIARLLCRLGDNRCAEGKRSLRKVTQGSHPDKHPGKGRQTEKLPAAIWLAALVCCIALMAVRLPGGLTVSCLDVGQGDGALLQLPDGTACLIDGGSSSVGSLWEYRIGPAVKYYGIRTLDYVFLSHADSDHISGIREYLESYEPGAFGNAHGITLKNLVLPPAADPEDFEELRQLAAQAGVTVLQMEAQDVIGNEKSGWKLNCLAPEVSSLSGDKNGDSMVLRLDYGDFRMLFTGDLEGEAETKLAQSGEDLRCSVLKVGHHGSKGASSELFLQAVQPEAAIISCGKNNSYGHPAPAAVARLLGVGADLYCTTEYGAVRIKTDGKTYMVSGYLK